MDEFFIKRFLWRMIEVDTRPEYNFHPMRKIAWWHRRRLYLMYSPETRYTLIHRTYEGKSCQVMLDLCSRPMRFFTSPSTRAQAGL